MLKPVREREYLTELSGELMIDLVESATKRGELLASLVGDKELSHAFPIDVLGWLESDIGELPYQESIHSLFLSSILSLNSENGGRRRWSFEGGCQPRVLCECSDDTLGRGYETWSPGENSTLHTYV